MVDEHGIHDTWVAIPDVSENPSDDELLMRAQWLGAQRQDSPMSSPWYGSAKSILGSPVDQDSPAGVSNPYWEIIRRLPARPGLWDQMPHPDSFLGSITLGIGLSVQIHRKPGWMALERQRLCKRYSWAIPSPRAISFIERELCGQPIVEICAGSGYWAWQLSQVGVEIDAYDPNPPGDNHFVTHGPYYDVKRDDHTVVGGYPDRALMISWPPCGDTFAAEALELFEGDTLIYIGEEMSGCCADDDFFIALSEDWDLDCDCASHVQWDGMHDVLNIYRRKSVSRPRARRDA